MNCEWVKTSKFKPQKEDINGNDKFLVSDGTIVWDALIDDQGNIRDYHAYYIISSEACKFWIIIKPPVE